MKRYIGKREKITVERYMTRYGWSRDEAEKMVADGSVTEMRVYVATDDGAVYELPNVRERQSPDGFAWGYLGSGPSALAFSILTDLLGAEPPPGMGHDFKAEFLAPLDGDRGFEIEEGPIREWMAEQTLRALA